MVCLLVWYGMVCAYLQQQKLCIVSLYPVVLLNFILANRRRTHSHIAMERVNMKSPILTPHITVNANKPNCEQATDLWHLNTYVHRSLSEVVRWGQMLVATVTGGYQHAADSLFAAFDGRDRRAQTR